MIGICTLLTQDFLISAWWYIFSYWFAQYFAWSLSYLIRFDIQYCYFSWWGSFYRCLNKKKKTIWASFRHYWYRKWEVELNTTKEHRCVVKHRYIQTFMSLTREHDCINMAMYCLVRKYSWSCLDSMAHVSELYSYSGVTDQEP